MVNLGERLRAAFTSHELPRNSKRVSPITTGEARVIIHSLAQPDTSVVAHAQAYFTAERDRLLQLHEAQTQGDTKRKGRAVLTPPDLWDKDFQLENTRGHIMRTNFVLQELQAGHVGSARELLIQWANIDIADRALTGWTFQSKERKTFTKQALDAISLLGQLTPDEHVHKAILGPLSESLSRTLS